MNKKLTIISLVFLSLLLVLSGCKKDEEKETKTEGAKYTQGVIKELYDNTFLMSSTDSRYSGDIVVPTRNEAGVTLNFEPGDEVKVYYSGKFFETDPAQVSKVISFTILKKASEAAIPAKDSSKTKQDERDSNKEDEKNRNKKKQKDNQEENIDDSVSTGDEMEAEVNGIDSTQNEEPSQENSETNENSENEKPKKKKSSETSENQSSQDSIVYYNMPELSVTGPKSTRKMSKNEYALVYDLIDNIDNWEKDEKGKNINPDFIIKDGNNTIAEFNSKTKMLKDTRSDIYIKLHKDLAKVLEEALTGNL